VAIVCIVGAFFSPVQFFAAYLAAYTYYLGLGLGCMAVLMIYHLTGGAWGFLSRRILEAGMSTLPLLALLFIPIACGTGYLYLWAQPEVVASDPKLQQQQFYLTVPLFWVRAVLYFVVWLGLSFWLKWRSNEPERTAGPPVESNCGMLSGIGLVAYGISLHFASIDWVMSLQPVFHSTIFGPLVGSGQVLSAMALVIIAIAWLEGRPPLALVTFLIIWAYMAWFQFMLIWIANLPVDVIWYLPRSRDGWQWVITAIAILHFAVPFFLLLMRSVKQTPRLVGWVAGLILFMQLVFDYYQVVPAFNALRLVEHWMDFLTPLAIGGLWLAYFLWQLSSQPLLPWRDVSEEHALHLRRLDESEQALEEALSHA
jgi:hypothetical protein